VLKVQAAPVEFFKLSKDCTFPEGIGALILFEEYKYTAKRDPG
jgi:hypothetical protein